MFQVSARRAETACYNKRRGWDSNPRDACTPNGFQDGTDAARDPASAMKLSERGSTCATVSATVIVECASFGGVREKPGVTSLGQAPRLLVC